MVVVTDQLQPSERYFYERRIRICPECQSSNVLEDEEQAEIVCCSCGAVLIQSGILPSRQAGYEQGTHSAQCDLDFAGGKGSHMSAQTYYKLLAQRSQKDLALRYRILKTKIGGHEEQVRKDLEYASTLMKDVGLWNTAVSPNQESSSSHIFAQDLGRYIRQFYHLSDFVFNLNFGPQGQKIFSSKRQLVIQNLLAMMLLFETWNSCTHLTITEKSEMVGKPLSKTVNNGLSVSSLKRGEQVIPKSGLGSDFILQAGDVLEIQDTRRIMRILPKLPLFSPEIMRCLRVFLRI